MPHPLSQPIRFVSLLSCVAGATAQNWQPTVPHSYAFRVVSDLTRGEVLLFGGTRGNLPPTTLLGTTFAFDGQRFRLAAPGQGPGPLGSGDLAHDPLRGRTVWLGRDSTVATGIAQTFEHDGSAWLPVPTALVPATGGPMTFVPELAVVVLQGVDGSTWHYDGAAWSPQGLATSPGPRNNFACAHDPLRQELVLFGGLAGGVPRADTWTYDSSGWQQRTPTTQPPAGGATMAFDAVLGRVVLRSEAAAAADRDWQWDGSDWSVLPTVATLPLTPRQVLIPSPATGRVWLTNDTPTDDFPALFAELQGNSWLPLAATVLPTERVGGAVAFDRRRATWWLHGGRMDASALRADLWRRSGGNWSRLLATPSPSPRADHTMVFDDARDRLVLFGGFGVTGLLGDTWELAAGQWQLRSGPGPAPRARAAACFDPVRRRVVLFGGNSGSSGGLRGDVWSLDGNGWSPWLLPSGPSPRAGASLCYDAAHDRLVLFGGDTAGGPDNGTWSLTPGGFVALAAIAPPSPRADAAMAYDPLCGCVVLHGGSNAQGSLADGFQLRGSTWLPRPIGSGMGPRSGAALLARPDLGRAELSRGWLLVPFLGLRAPLGDEWWLRPDPVAVVHRHGIGCAGGAGVPQLDPVPGSLPVLGSSFVLQVGNVPANPGLAVVALGSGLETFAGAPLPLDLALLGLPGCQLWLAPEQLWTAPAVAGVATLSLSLPNSPQLAGAVLAAQAVVFDVVGPGFAAASNGLVAIVH